MGKLRLLLVATAVLLCVTLCGCATANLTSNATPAEKKAAMCADARQGLAIAEIGLETAASPAQRAYWQKYLTGVLAAIELYCGGV